MPISSPVLTADILIYVDEAELLGGSGSDLRKACRRGELVRVRRGAYCLREVWESLEGPARHILVIRAAIRRMSGPFLLAGRSAAALWGLPYAAMERDDITLLVPYLGGGTSEPGVRRTCLSFESANPVEIDGIPATGAARTVLDIARTLDFARAVAIADRVQWRRDPAPMARDELMNELDRARYVRGGRHLDRVIEFSTSLSDSEGESRARAGFDLLGFEAPELQKEFSDPEGLILTDFHWKSVNSAGEFDGKMKYTRDEFTGGDPAAVVWREKRREDRLRRQVSTVLRIVWDDLHHPSHLARILSEAGVPRRRV
jgi:hypothetical protein